MKRYALPATLILMALLAGGGALWQFRLKPRMLVEQTRFDNMRGLMEGVVRFNSERRRMPASLAELVAAGYLPKEGTVYFSPMQHGSMHPSPLPYTACEYELGFARDAVTISIPSAVYSQPRFKFAPEAWRTLVVTADLRLLEPRR